jgi:hypothetical protein
LHNRKSQHWKFVPMQDCNQVQPPLPDVWQEVAIAALLAGWLEQKLLGTTITSATTTSRCTTRNGFCSVAGGLCQTKLSCTTVTSLSTTSWCMTWSSLGGFLLVAFQDECTWREIIQFVWCGHPGARNDKHVARIDPAVADLLYDIGWLRWRCKKLQMVEKIPSEPAPDSWWWVSPVALPLVPGEV